MLEVPQLTAVYMAGMPEGQSLASSVKRVLLSGGDAGVEGRDLLRIGVVQCVTLAMADSRFTDVLLQADIAGTNTRAICQGNASG